MTNIVDGEYSMVNVPHLEYSILKLCKVVGFDLSTIVFLEGYDDLQNTVSTFGDVLSKFEK